MKVESRDAPELIRRAFADRYEACLCEDCKELDREVPEE